MSSVLLGYVLGGVCGRELQPPAGTGRCVARPWQGLGHGGAAALTRWQDLAAAGGRAGVLLGDPPH